MVKFVKEGFLIQIYDSVFKFFLNVDGTFENSVASPLLHKFCHSPESASEMTYLLCCDGKFNGDIDNLCNFSNLCVLVAMDE